MSGRQSAVIYHQLNELLSRHPLGFHCPISYSQIPFWAVATLSTALYKKKEKVKESSLLASTCGTQKTRSSGPLYYANLSYTFGETEIRIKLWMK